MKIPPEILHKILSFSWPIQLNLLCVNKQFLQMGLSIAFKMLHLPSDNKKLSVASKHPEILSNCKFLEVDGDFWLGLNPIFDLLNKLACLTQLRIVRFFNLRVSEVPYEDLFYEKISLICLGNRLESVYFKQVVLLRFAVLSPSIYHPYAMRSSDKTPFQLKRLRIEQCYLDLRSLFRFKHWLRNCPLEKLEFFDSLRSEELVGLFFEQILPTVLPKLSYLSYKNAGPFSSALRDFAQFKFVEAINQTPSELRNLRLLRLNDLGGLSEDFWTCIKKMPNLTQLFLMEQTFPCSKGFANMLDALNRLEKLSRLTLSDGWPGIFDWKTLQELMSVVPRATFSHLHLKNVSELDDGWNPMPLILSQEEFWWTRYPCTLVFKRFSHQVLCWKPQYHNQCDDM